MSYPTHIPIVLRAHTHKHMNLSDFHNDYVCKFRSRQHVLEEHKLFLYGLEYIAIKEIMCDTIYESLRAYHILGPVKII